MTQSTNKELFIHLAEDALLWKARRQWQQAINPDKEAMASDNIATFLLKIKNDVKRDRYVSLVADEINRFVKDKDSRINQIQLSLEELEANYLVHKKESTKKIILKLQKDLELAQDNALPSIKATSLKQLIKQKKSNADKATKEAAKKAQQAKQKLEASDFGLPEGFKGDLYKAVEYGLAPDPEQNFYLFRNDKGHWSQKTTFTMEVRYLIHESPVAAYRIISMTNIFGVEKTVTFNTDDLTSLSSFKKVLNRYSNFSFSGADAELTRLNEFLQVDEKHATQLNTLGYNKTHKMWAWVNGVVDLDDPLCRFIPADEFGMVVLNNEKTFHIPTASKYKVGADDIDDIAPEQRFIHTDLNISFKKWSELHLSVHKDNSIIGQLWWIATTYRDLIFNNPSIRRMPLLFLYGQPGTGKGVFAGSLMSMFGYPQSAIMLESGGSTQKGILRRFAQFRNAIVWLDEYKNTINKALIGTIKQLYDGESYTRAIKSNDNRTDSSPINSSAIVSGQDLPIIEAAVLERHILLQFDARQRTDEDLAKFNQLSGIEAHGLTSVTNEVQSHRLHFSTVFYEKFKQAYKDNRTQLAPMEVKDRYIMNYSILLAVYDSLADKLEFPFTRNTLLQLLWESAYKQNNLTKDNNDLAKWWQTIEQLVRNEHKLRHGHDFILEGNSLFISIKNFHPYYVKELRARGDNFFLEKSVIENYLKSDITTFKSHKRKRMQDENTYVFEFDYEILRDRYNVDIIPDRSENDGNNLLNTQTPF